MIGKGNEKKSNDSEQNWGNVEEGGKDKKARTLG